jgi:hypothetical protein
MTRLEKCELAKEKGYTYDPETGKVFNPKGKELISKCGGYYEIRNTSVRMFSHQFAWYWVYNEVVDYIDHIDQIKTDNRIDNLRSVTNQQNAFNNQAKGYVLQNNKWRAYIHHNNKKIHLGYYKTEEEARQSYLLAKEKYHII